MPLRREPSREHELPVGSSWRMVEGGENDSFDTSIVPELDFEDDIPLSSGPSQGNFSLASQDSAHSISDFVDRADDERVILRTPFRPSIPTTRQPSDDVHRTPEPEFYMPSIHMESPSQGRSSSGRSSRTIRPTMDEKERIAMRLRNQRQQSGYGSLLRKRNNNSSSNDAKFGGREAQRQPTDRQQQTVGRRVMDSAPHALLDVLAWVADIVGMALRMLKLPLAMIFAVWLMIGATIILRNMVTQSITTSLSPICKIPGVGALSLPFCPQFGVTPAGSDEQLSAPGGQSVEFDDLMNVQASFEQVLERSADGVSLPMEMKRSESSIRDLRTMVRYSELPARDELVFHFDEYIATARQTASDLQKFNTHVGSAVDSVISINHWTSRYLDALDASTAAADADSAGTGLAVWTSWLFAPFQPATVPFDERALLDKYIEHTALVSDRIAGLLVEAQAVLRLLTRAEDHLSLIYDVVTRSHRSVRDSRDDVLWTLWSLVGANNRRISDLNGQLRLLRAVDTQRSQAVSQVSALVVELEKIEAGLGDLRDRVAEPGLARSAIGPGPGLGDRGAIPLSVHIETIDRGVDRLEQARRRIRDAEDDKVREALARGGVKDEARAIDA
ncbi:hypothetical protein VD0002_g10035 [Verticillium dahliae]|uniref:Uncharacterized protein n=2 Tax=Verticillium dahliae TaxID=27337 RepID=G2WT11_VERDV|nr:uncharacterized protein VDAG_00934 [Verticillium dahliae VdLs.17]KAH6701648.1 hypothetical protein EV126DRAFT_522217 [Verticillium dahliae]EGY17252.1 hypothetical protein VDAG_00934 [Verticillium dahliae VdLs.17]PNH32570.1 hypothetical protein BJF96_g4270 [Verticillium dahliae]PNH44134.1 hypothetical protein VD0003_g9490 [Verticillium dahliae]PNH53953.1 hypothetical protein VD0002_g10035 [Verticillium dahliae]